ncbi:MAG: response regulator transcription factor [Chloroflexota bacterium]
MSEKITVMIVDDHLMVRDGLKVFLSVYEDIEVIGEAQDGAEALRLYPRLKPQVILMDLVMPEMDGPTTISQIRENDWPVHIVALTSFDDRDLVQKAIQAGAVGFLYKDVHPEKLAAAIRSAAHGQGTLDAAATQVLIDAAQQPAVIREDLTPRENEVLALIVQGKTNKQIAASLTISLATVRLHVSNILSKLNAANRTEAASIALQKNLV